MARQREAPTTCRSLSSRTRHLTQSQTATAIIRIDYPFRQGSWYCTCSHLYAPVRRGCSSVVSVRVPHVIAPACLSTNLICHFQQYVTASLWWTAYKGRNYVYPGHTPTYNHWVRSISQVALRKGNLDDPLSLQLAALWAYILAEVGCLHK